VTPDEIQRLMSGYATGSLTESERKHLFEAALDDQHLFDQLAQEQAVKELIDQPGARDRLIAALEPAEKSPAIGAWKKPLAWGLAAMFVVSMSVAALMLTRSGIRTQIAQKKVDETRIDETKIGQPQVAQLSQPSASPAAVPGPAAPAVSSSPAPPPAKELHDRRSTTGESRRRELDAAVRALPNAPAQGSGPANSRTGSRSGSGSGLGPTEELRKNDELKKTAGSATAPAPAPPPAQPQIVPESRVVGQLSQPPAPQPQGFVAGQPQGARQAPPDRQATQSTNGELSNSQLQSPQDAAGRAQTSRSQAQTGPNQVQSAGGGGRGAGVGGAAGAIPSRAARVMAPARFAFDYSIDGDDLVFKFSADGYFSLHIAPGGLTIVDSRVAAGSTRREHITANGTEAVIVFSASAQSDAQGVSIETRARSLTVEDPAHKRIDVLVKFY
jgi:hypothetical protein